MLQQLLVLLLYVFFCIIDLKNICLQLAGRCFHCLYVRLYVFLYVCTNAKTSYGLLLMQKFLAMTRVSVDFYVDLCKICCDSGMPF